MKNLYLLATSLLFIGAFSSTANAQFIRNYQSGSNENVSKGDVVTSDDQSSGFDIAFGFGQSDEFEIEVVSTDDGLEPSYCTNSDYYGSYTTQSSKAYYPRQVLTTFGTQNNERLTVIGDTEAGDITATCGTSNAFISCIEFSSTCTSPSTTKSIIFGKTNYTIEMRDAYEYYVDQQSHDVYFVGQGEVCSGNKKLLIGRVDISSSTPTLTAKFLTIKDGSSVEQEFQPRAIAVDGTNIYIGGKYEGATNDAFILSVDIDVLSSTPPTNPTTVLKRLFDNGSTVNSSIWDMEIGDDGYVYAVGLYNSNTAGSKATAGVILGFETDLDFVQGVSYTTSSTDDNFRGMRKQSGNLFIASGVSTNTDREVVACHFRVQKGKIFPQYIDGTANNMHQYARSGADMNLNVATCTDGSEVTLFNRYDNSGTDNQYIIRTENDLSIQSTCYSTLEMDVEFYCSDINTNVSVTTTHIAADEDNTITISREDNERGAEVCYVEPEPMADDDESLGNDRMSVKEFENVSIYPNPGTGLFSVESDQEVLKVKVYTTNGRLIDEVSGEDVSAGVDLSQYQSGQYLFKVVTSSGFHTKKVLKK